MRLIVIRILAFAALLGCLYLSYQRQIGEISSIKGCGGPEGSCANALGSKWSLWLGLPVTTLAASLWIGVIISTFIRKDELQPRIRFAQSVLGLVLVLAALWFIFVMIVVIGSFCPWCAALHALGLIVGVLLLMNPATMRHTIIVFSIALAFFIPLPLAQLLSAGPQTHSVAAAGSATDSGGASGTRNLTYLNGRLDLTLGDDPFIGPADAEHVFVEFYDYTCKSCRDLYQDLGALNNQYPDQFAVVLLPVPLERACNDKLAPIVRDHPTACEKARIALAAWKANPSKFYEVHSALMQMPIGTPPEAAYKIVADLVGGAALDAVYNDPSIAAAIQRNVDVFGLLTGYGSDDPNKNLKMPKLLVGTRVYSGLMQSTGVFVKTLGEVIDTTSP